MTKDEIIERIKNELPPIVARRQLGQFTGGLIAPRTLANLDCLGQGPKERIRMGRKVAYPRDAFINWLEGRLEVEDVS